MSVRPQHPGAWADAIEQALQVRRANFSAAIAWSMLAIVLLAFAPFVSGGLALLVGFAVCAWCAAGRFGRALRDGEPAP